MLMSGSRDDNTLRMIALMHGKRLVTASEASETSRFNESLINPLPAWAVSWDAASSQWRSSTIPEFKIFIDANHRPTIRGTDDAIWYRIRLVPFEVQFSKDQIDKDLWRKLREELPGILAWAVAGCLAWQHDGLEPPDSITDAVTSYRAEQDLVAGFLAERTEPDPDMTIRTSELYADFRQWCTESGERDIPKQRWFTERIKSKYKMAHKRDGDHFFGVRLRSHTMTPRWDGESVAVPVENIQ